MALDNTPWFVGGGAQHSPEVARSLAYASTNGAEGICGISDLRVQAQPVPNGSVQVIPGAALLLNRYAGGSGQTYALRNATGTDIPVLATGSGGGRTDLIVARILDPQYEGAPPPNPLTFQYSRIVIIQGVPAGTKTAKELNLSYPAVELARITLPASTATVTASMITDLRKVAQPRSVRLVEMNAPAYQHKLTSPTMVQWPNYRPTVAVPEWASHVSIIAHVASIISYGGSAKGLLANTLGAPGATQFRSSEVIYDVDVAAGDAARWSFVIGGKGPIPAAFRGTNQVLGIEGNRISATSDAVSLITVPGSQVLFDVMFTEQAA